jgi:hypothetical protein
MSDFINSIKNNIKNNIIPIQNAIKEKTNNFINTFVDDFEDTESDESYSDNFDSESEGEMSYPPTQQIFNELISKVIIKNNITSIQLSNENTLVKNELTNEEEINNEINNVNIIEESDNEEIKKNDVIEEKINNLSLENNTNIVEEDIVLIKNLYTLSKILPYQKLYINSANSKKINFEILIDESYFPQLSRWYYSQNRINTIETIEKLTNETITIINNFKENENKELMEKYANLLKNCIDGINNLKITYESDYESVNKLNKIITKINDIL